MTNNNMASSLDNIDLSMNSVSGSINQAGSQLLSGGAIGAIGSAGGYSISGSINGISVTPSSPSPPSPNWQSVNLSPYSAVYPTITTTPITPIVHPPEGYIMVSDGKGSFKSVHPLDFFLTWLKKESKTEQAKVAMAEVLEKFSDLLLILKISQPDPGMEEDE